MPSPTDEPMPGGPALDTASGGADVAVVIATQDRCDELLDTLSRLTELSERPTIVVVDNASGDATVQAVRRHYPSVTVHALDENLGGAGRNVGVAAVSAPYVAFCDDDTWWDPGALSRAATLLDDDPAVAVVTARIVVEPGGRPDPVCAEMEASPLGRTGGRPELGSFLAGASMVRREAFEAVGGFHPRIRIGGEEQLLACDLMVAGWRLVYADDVVVHHRPSTARDPHLRRRQGIRNALWFWWLRRPARSAARRTLHLLRTVPRDRISLRGVLDALAGLPWVLRERKVVPPTVERKFRLLDPSQQRSRATRHVS